MLSKILGFKIIAVLAVLVGGYFYLKQFTIIMKKTLKTLEIGAKNDSTNIAGLTKENKMLNDTIWTKEQSLELLKSNEGKHQGNEMALLKSLRSCQSQFVEAINNGGIVRDSIFLESDKKLFKERTWRVVERPKSLIIK